MERCLDSLLAQTRPIDELIVVDDGSTDGTSAILARYASVHAAIRVIPGPREGAAGARNAGLDTASGEWLGFVDADDWAEPRMFEVLLGLAQRGDLDMALCNARYHYEGRKPDRPVYTDSPPAGPMSGAEWLRRKLENRSILHAVWMHLYRRSFIEEHRLRFVVGLMHEDVTWTTRALLLAGRVAYIDEPLYAYRRNERSFPVQERDRRLLKIIGGAKTDARILAELAGGAKDARLAHALRWQLVDGGLSVFHRIRQLSTPQARREQWRLARADGYLGLLWRNAVDLRQKRKLASRYVRSLIA